MTSLSPNRIQAIEEKQNKVNSVFNINGSNTLELAYMRRICIREQKLHLILRKLEQDLPVIISLIVNIFKIPFIFFPF